MAVLHRNQPGRGGGPQQAGRPEIHHEPVEIRQLVALRIHREIVRVADEDIGGRRRITVVHPRPQARMLRVEVLLHPPVDGDGRRQVQGAHGPRNELRVTQRRVIRAQIMRRREVVRKILEVVALGGDALGKQRVGLGKTEPHAIVVHLLHPAHARAAAQHAGRGHLEILHLGLVPIN
jgi:hypothetical protein